MAYVKKLIGLLAAAGIIAVLVFAVLNRNNYRSMLFDEGVSLFGIFGTSGNSEEALSDPMSDVPVFESPEDFMPEYETEDSEE